MAILILLVFPWSMRVVPEERPAEIIPVEALCGAKEELHNSGFDKEVHEVDTVPQGCGGCNCWTCYRVSYFYETPVWLLGGRKVQSRIAPFPIAEIPQGWQCAPDRCACELGEIVPSGDFEEGKALGNLRVTIRFGRACPGAKPSP